MAVMSDDRKMLELCQPGEDAHGYMGGRIGSVSYEDMQMLLSNGDKQAEDLRQLGKVANLSLQYRTSAKTLVRVARVQYGLTITQREADAIHGTYLTSYTNVPEYWRNQINTVKDQGWVETITGRRIHVGFEDDWFRLVPKKDNPQEYVEIDNQWKATSTSINFPIQGSGADQKYLALAILKNLLPKYDGRFYFELHDGIFLIVPDDKAEKALHEIRHALSNLPYRQAWGVNLPIQFPVDAKIGKSWGQLVEVK